MATTLLPQTPHHFSHLPAHYSPAVYEQHTVQQTPGIDRLTAISVASAEQPLSYTSPPRLSAHPVYHRRTSKSPNITARTPIRHNRPDMSRHRSNTRPQTLIAYTEQQIGQGQTENPSTVYTPSMDAVASSYQGQHFGFPAVTTAYTHQHPYFDTNNTHYMQLPTQQDQLNVVNMYTSARRNLPLRNTGAGALNAGEVVYTQPRSSQVPSIPSNPAKFPPIPQPLESTPNDMDVVNSRQKPQCWEHGCNGRQFSTFSNLLRHQREKSGTATKARCPHCGTEFTRTTARNGHLYGGKCKGIPDGNKDENSPTSEDRDPQS